MPIVNGGDEKMLIVVAESYLAENRHAPEAIRVRALLKSLRAGEKVEALGQSSRPVIRELVAWGQPRSSSLTNYVLVRILERIGPA